ncbi:MAG: sec-independent protein translocase protein TatB [Actinomycetota bacterium]|jgi:sec-independent protein translocase protein TatA|nr:sec-independent protein translocase protein TatB [Actinomycetota bacterium]
MSLGPAEILVVLVLALIVFGPKRLPEVGRQVGGALRELRKVQDTVQSEIRSVLDDTAAPVRTMYPTEPLPAEPVPDEPRAAIEPPAGEPPVSEPDLGDEQPHHEPSDIDGLSGGTFS